MKGSTYIEKGRREMSEDQRAKMSQVGENWAFIFNSNLRVVFQDELDSRVARFLGLSYDELCYILDPEDICDPGCINETFRVLKGKRLREYGEYCTRRLVLDDCHNFNYPK